VSDEIGAKSDQEAGASTTYDEAIGKRLWKASTELTHMSPN
jgi:hypothetical protein